MARSLKFRPDGRFIIAQFTDLHWHNGEEEDQQTRALMEGVMDAEKPDLVALTGDVIAGGGCRNPAESLKNAVAAIEEREIPWAMVFGNHDDEGSCDRTALMEAQRSCQLCLSEPGPEEVSGVGNYTLAVQSSEGDAPAAALYFIDSRSYSTLPGLDGYGWIERDQIEWFLQTSQQINHAYAQSGGSHERIPALAFFHIPLPEYNEVWDHHPCRGHKQEKVCCPEINTGFFAALREAGDVMGTFVGHDHTNDYDGELQGIRLIYGRGSGYHTYGREGFPRGGRVIELREGEREFNTWMRLEGGEKDENPPEHAPQGRVMSD